MSAPVTSALGQAFWHNVQLGNLSFMKGRILRPEQLPEVCSRDNILPDLNPSPLDSNITRAGLVRLSFRVKGAGPEVKKEVKIDWSYIGHGQNRDSMLGKLLQPTVFSILNLLQHLNIPQTQEERQSARVLEKERVAKDALQLISGVAADWHHPTD